jgi:nitric oxide reductase subunit B
VLGLAHTWPAVNQWTHGTMITPMHGHLAFFGAYVMIVLALITYALPYVSGNPDAEERHGGVGLWSFWLQVGGMTGMTMAFAAAGVAQVYMERILGFGYLDTQEKIQVHFQMLLVAAFIFTLGVLLFLWDFFILHPKRGETLAEPVSSGARAPVHG